MFLNKIVTLREEENPTDLLAVQCPPSSKLLKVIKINLGSVQTHAVFIIALL